MSLLKELFALFWLLVLITVGVSAVGFLIYFIFWEHNVFIIAGSIICIILLIIHEVFIKDNDWLLRIKYNSAFPKGLPTIVTDNTMRVEQLKLRLNEEHEQMGILWTGDDFLTYLLNPDITTSIVTSLNATDEYTQRHMFEVETTLPQGVVKTHIGTLSGDLQKVDSWYFHTYGLTAGEMNNACIIMSDQYISDPYLIKSAALFADMTYPHKLFITRDKSVKDYLSRRAHVKCLYCKNYYQSYGKFLRYIRKAMRE